MSRGLGDVYKRQLLDIKLDLFDEASENESFNDDSNYSNHRKNKKTQKSKKSGFGSMDKFLEKFEDDKSYTDKIDNIDKNKMFFNHFKNTLPKFEKN